MLTHKVIGISSKDIGMKKILITGHDGLVGRALSLALKDAGFEIVGLDLNVCDAKFKGDICNEVHVSNAIKGCIGVIHLAAVSRVVWGENNPDLCWKTNAEASQQLLNIALKTEVPPWVLVASSREVYGEPSELPVDERCIAAPVNIYGKSKMAMEDAAITARSKGLQTAIVRLANVYGSTDDHADRVLPAFCRAAVLGHSLRVDGLENTFDFTHISDTIDGLVLIVDKLESGAVDLPPIHLLPGIATTLKEAAELAIKAAASSSTIQEAPSRSYDVSRFVGDASRAKSILGWQAKITPQQGISLLVQDFKVKELGEK